MRLSIDYKMTLYVLVVGCACIVFRMVTLASFPQILGLAVGAGLCLISVALTVFEIMKGLDFFYGFAEHCNGYCIVNSGFIAGMSAFFFSRDWQMGIMIVILLGICTLIERLCVRYIISLTKNDQK